MTRNDLIAKFGGFERANFHDVAMSPHVDLRRLAEIEVFASLRVNLDDAAVYRLSCLESNCGDDDPECVPSLPAAMSALGASQRAATDFLSQVELDAVSQLELDEENARLEGLDFGPRS